MVINQKNHHLHAKLAHQLRFPIRNRQVTRVSDNGHATLTLYIKGTLSGPQG